MSDHIETIRGLLEAACAGKESTIRSRKEFGLHFQDEAAWRDKYRAALVWLDTFAVPVDVPQPVAGDTREALAAYAHDAWGGWMKYLFSKGERIGRLNADSVGGIDVLWQMPAWAVERWTRQMNTSYADLPEEEKASDREEADRMLAIMGQAQPPAPQADWSQAPDWAMWWAVNGNGYAGWFKGEPKRNDYYWFDFANSSYGRVAGAVEISMGIDWRTLKQQRPEGTP